MLPVTQDFLDQIKTAKRRIYGKAVIDYTDPFLDQSIQAAVNEQITPSFPGQTADAVADPAHKWASLDGSWVLDGSYHLMPETAAQAETLQVGWWGATLAGAGGAFGAPYPTLTVTFFSRPIHSLKVVGDSARGEYPVDFDITLYDAGDVVLHTENVVGNAAVTWSQQLSASVNQVVKMTLEIKKWSHEGRQVKILEFFTSIQEVYEGDDILLVSLLEERDVSQGSLPVGNISANEIEVRLNNIDRRFDAGNTQSPLYQLLKANRRIRAWLGIEAENLDSDHPPTFARASTAYLSDGTEVAQDEPRFEAGQFGQAILIEEGTTNLLSAAQTTDFSSGWTYAADVTVDDDVTTAPDGTLTADRIVEVANTNQHRLYVFLGDRTGTPMTYSVYAKAAERSWLAIRHGNVSSGAWFDLANGIIGTVDASVLSASITPVGNGWYRCTISVTGIFSEHIIIGPCTDDGVGAYLGDATKGVYAWHAQVETKAYPTSWHLGSSTRAAETLTIPTAGVLDPQEGTIEFWFTYLNSPGVYSRLFSWGGSWANPPASDWLKIYFGTGWGLNRVSFEVAKAGSPKTGIAAILPSAIQPEQWCYVAANWLNGQMKITLYNSATGQVATASVTKSDWPSMSGYTAASVGHGEGNGYQSNCIIDDFRISSRARTDAEILAAYQSGQPLPVDADTTYKLSFNSSIYPVETCWLPLGTFWSGDWNAPEEEIWTHTTGRDRLELLRKSTYSVSEVAQNTTLYDLAVAVLQDAGLTAEEYWVDTELQDYDVPYAWFEPISHREALRRIAEACLGQVYADRNGVIRVEGPSFLAGQASSVLTAGRDDFFRKDHPVKWSEIANYIEVETQPLRPAAAAEEVYRSNDAVSIDASEVKTLTVFFNEPPVIESVASLEDQGIDTSITDATYYAWGATIEVTNSGGGADTFTLVITGKLLTVLNKERAVAQDVDSITDNGKLRYKFPDNPLVQTLAVAQDIADRLLAAYKNPRRDIELEWRGNPALILADRITAPDYKDVSQADYHVISQTLEFDGGLRSTVKGRKA